MNCIFTGHRDLPPDPSPLRRLLEEEIARQRRRGVTVFASGGAVGFDLLAAETVLEAKAEDPSLSLWMVLPYEGHERYFPAEDKARLLAILERADEVRFVSQHYYKGCLLARDRVLAQAADTCVCYLTRSSGGTAYTVRQCAARDIPIVNLADLL